MPFTGAALQVAAGIRGVYYIDFDGASGITYLGRLESCSNSDEARIDEIATPIRPCDGAVFTTDFASRALARANLDKRQLTILDDAAGGRLRPSGFVFDRRGRVLFLSWAGRGTR